MHWYLEATCCKSKCCREQNENAYRHTNEKYRGTPQNPNGKRTQKGKESRFRIRNIEKEEIVFRKDLK